MYTYMCIHIVNFIPWQGDFSCFPCIRYPARSNRHELQVKTNSLSEAIEAQGPHRRCGGRDIACAISARARRSTNLGVDTLLLLWCFQLGPPSTTLAVLSGEKRFARPGLGW